MGGIFLKDEDGYKIILRSLEHYKKRLRLIESSPELAESGSFSQIILQEAMKMYPKVNALIIRIPQCLDNSEQLNLLENEIPLFQKALESYKSDIHKAQNSQHEYYQKLVDLSNISKNEIALIEGAIQKVQFYSE